jgi:hypothetical protein
MVETETYTIEAPDGTVEEIELPSGLLDVFGQGEESAVVLGDMAVNMLAQQAHVQVHHAEGDVPDDFKTLNEKMEELFESRFGVSLAEAMGHSH